MQTSQTEDIKMNIRQFIVVALSIIISSIAAIAFILYYESRTIASIHNGILQVQNSSTTVRLSNGKIISAFKSDGSSFFFDISGHFRHRQEFTALSTNKLIPAKLTYLDTHFTLSDARNCLFHLNEDVLPDVCTWNGQSIRTNTLRQVIDEMPYDTFSVLSVKIQDGKNSSCETSVNVYGPVTSFVINNRTNIANTPIQKVDYINDLPAEFAFGHWFVDIPLVDVYVSYTDNGVAYVSAVSPAQHIATNIFVDPNGLISFNSSVPLRKIRLSLGNKILGEYFPDYISP